MNGSMRNPTEWHLVRNSVSRAWVVGARQAREDGMLALERKMMKQARKAWDRAYRQNRSSEGYSPMCEVLPGDFPPEAFGPVPSAASSPQSQRTTY